MRLVEFFIYDIDAWCSYSWNLLFWHPCIRYILSAMGVKYDTLRCKTIYIVTWIWISWQVVTAQCISHYWWKNNWYSYQDHSAIGRDIHRRERSSGVNHKGKGSPLVRFSFDRLWLTRVPLSVYGLLNRCPEILWKINCRYPPSQPPCSRSPYFSTPVCLKIAAKLENTVPY